MGCSVSSVQPSASRWQAATKFALWGGKTPGATGCGTDKDDTETGTQKDTCETGDTCVDTGVPDTCVDSCIDTVDTGHTGHTGETDTVDTDTGEKNGPWFQDIYYCEGTVDSLSCTFVFEHGSVPSIIELEQPAWGLSAGTLMMAFVDESAGLGLSEISIMVSLDDGLTWGGYAQVEFDFAGKDIDGIVDPELIQRPDGRIGLIGLENNFVLHPEESRRIDYFISTDPYAFAYETMIFEDDSGKPHTDPDIVLSDDTIWMFLSNGLNIEGPDSRSIPADMEFTEGFFNGPTHMIIPELGVPGAIYQAGEVVVYGHNYLNQIWGNRSTNGVDFYDSFLLSLPISFESVSVDPLQQASKSDWVGFAVGGVPAE
ncbi:MAG: hypothetical protein WC901_01700 [Candidatus Margulisiibacteriota bacterium]